MQLDYWGNKMSTHKATGHKRGSQGMSESMASELNRQQAAKVIHKMGGKKMHSSKPKQGYTQHRPGVDVFHPKV